MVRLKHRYIVGKIVPEIEAKSVSFSDIEITKTILFQVEKNFGLFGLAALENGFKIKYCNDKTRIVIIRCRHGPHRFVTSLIPILTVIGGHRAKFITLYVGATIMQCNKYITRFQKTYLNKLVGKIESAKERHDLIQNVMELELE